MATSSAWSRSHPRLSLDPRFGIYLIGLALVLMTIPNTLLAVFGIASTQENWIRVVGMLSGRIGVIDLAGAGWTWSTLAVTRRVALSERLGACLSISVRRVRRQ